MNSEKIVNAVFAFGATVVILGAWQKLSHGPLADVLLTAGLVTEAILFSVIGVMELVKKNDVLPEGLSKPVSSSADTDTLASSVNDLNKTIKKVFNQ